MVKTRRRTKEDKKKSEGSLPGQRLRAILKTILIEDRIFQVSIIFFGLLFVLIFLGWITFVFPTTYQATFVEQGSGALGAFDYSIRHPRWLSEAEDDVLSLTLINTETVSQSDVIAYLTFHGNTPIAHGEKGSNMADFGTLLVSARKTQTIDLRLDRWTTSPMTATLWVSVNGTPAQELATLTFRETRIPQAKTALQGLMGIIVATLGSGFAWLLKSTVEAASSK